MKKKILAALLSGSLLLGGGTALADSMDSFKEAYLSSPVDNRTFSDIVVFISPYFHGELHGKGFMLRDATFKMDGNITWQYTNPKTNVTTEANVIPFYIAQDNNAMTMYVRRNNTWSKFNIPAVPVALANAIKTTDVNILKQNMSAVKNVDIVNEDSLQRAMKITLDGKKLAELLHTYNDDNIKNLSQAEQAEQKSFMEHLSDALQNTDVTVSWTVDKQNWKTTALSISLTDLIRAYGRDYLDDSAKGEIKLSDADRAFYESLGYYAELSLTYYLEKDDRQPPTPDGVSSARTNDNVFSDWVQMLGLGSKK